MPTNTSTAEAVYIVFRGARVEFVWRNEQGKMDIFPARLLPPEIKLMHPECLRTIALTDDEYWAVEDIPKGNLILTPHTLAVFGSLHLADEDRGLLAVIAIANEDIPAGSVIKLKRHKCRAFDYRNGDPVYYDMAGFVDSVTSPVVK